MKKRIKCFILFISVFVYYGCNTVPDKDIKYYRCQIDSEIDMYPDSSYFSDIRCMQYYKDKVYALDVSRRDIAVLDNGLNNVEFVGWGGRGPNELLSPTSFYVYDDTVNILDLGSQRIKRFYNGVFIDADRIDDDVDYRFFCTQKYYYIPAITESETFLVMPKQSDNENTSEYYGEINRVGSPVGTMLRNNRYLLYHDSGIYSVPEVFPFIEKYDLNNFNMIEKIDLAKVNPYKSNLDYIRIKNDESEKSFYTQICDCYIEGDALFVLCNVLGERYKANQVLKIRLLPDMSVEGIYELPNNVYNALCLSPTHIYAFNPKKSAIEVIKRTDE